MFSLAWKAHYGPDTPRQRYDPGRRHSALGYLSPIDYERSALETLEFSSP